MESKIAVTTVSGKAYYRLVNELKQRNLPFLSLIPGEPIPPSITVVITTEKEKPLVKHPLVLIYDAEADPSDTIDEAIRAARSKDVYEEVDIGVDPGKTFGIAVLGDGRVLRKEERPILGMAVDAVLTELKKTPAKVQRVKIGYGIPKLAEEIARRLDTVLTDDTGIEMVREAGTSIRGEKGFRRKITDADAAVSIARKKGKIYPRRKDS